MAELSLHQTSQALLSLADQPGALERMGKVAAALRDDVHETIIQYMESLNDRALANWCTRVKRLAAPHLSTGLSRDDNAGVDYAFNEALSRFGVKACEFSAGFVSKIVCAPKDFAEHFEQILAIAPVRRIKLCAPVQSFEHLVSSARRDARVENWITAIQHFNSLFEKIQVTYGKAPGITYSFGDHQFVLELPFALHLGRAGYAGSVAAKDLPAVVHVCLRARRTVLNKASADDVDDFIHSIASGRVSISDAVGPARTALLCKPDVRLLSLVCIGAPFQNESFANQIRAHHWPTLLARLSSTDSGFSDAMTVLEQSRKALVGTQLTDFIDVLGVRARRFLERATGERVPDQERVAKLLASVAYPHWTLRNLDALDAHLATMKINDGLVASAWRSTTAALALAADAHPHIAPAMRRIRDRLNAEPGLPRVDSLVS